MATKIFISAVLCLASTFLHSQNRDPSAVEIFTSDIDHFWEAYDKAKPDFDPKIFEKIYLEPGSKGIKGFMKGRIVSADHLTKTIKLHPKYYASIRASTDSIKDIGFGSSFAKLKEVYPRAIFPPVYFVIGTLNSGGTTSPHGLIIGAEMYGLTPQTPKNELSTWLQSVIKPASQVQYIVAHELIHVQQHYSLLHRTTLLSQSIKEGSADFLGELISGKQINQHVHDFANPREKELWLEFKKRMDKKDYTGWLYGSSAGRPNDLGYWMGYKITKAYYDQAEDKKKAVDDILHIKDFHKFLDKSGYALRF